MCYLHNVYLLFLPAHTSHVLQPLDLGRFSSLKTAYRRLLGDWVALTDATRVGKAQFLDFYAEARKSAFTAKNIESGWRATGLYPVNRHKALLSRWVMVKTPEEEEREGEGREKKRRKKKEKKKKNNTTPGPAHPPEPGHTPPRPASSHIRTPSHSQDVVRLLATTASTPGTRLIVRKVALGFDRRAVELAMKDREIARLREQIEQLQPRKRKKVKRDLNQEFVSSCRDSTPAEYGATAANNRYTRCNRSSRTSSRVGVRVRVGRAELQISKT